ncbi:MAG: hypothetical protein PHT41_05100 [Candidatus Omnitrophica bacterium]|nr:hypothetical protein [Candidatus Omnitrophota bacterium]MDD5238312.1 hypothetical protein [Candidatus Omnitrophota bacterium]
MMTRKRIKQEKKSGLKPFVEPKLIKRGSLKEVTFASEIGGGSPVP